MNPALGEGDPGSRHQILDRARDQHLAGLADGGDAGADMKRDPTQGPILDVALSGVNARPDVDAEGANGALDRQRATDRTGRAVERRDGEHLAASTTPFNASFIVGGQIKGEPPRLFRTFAEGNFIEAGTDTPFFQTGEAKYGKPIIDRVIRPATNLSDAMKCVLVSFDSTMRSNLSVGMPIDLVCYERNSLRISIRHRFVPGDAYFTSLSIAWSEGVRSVFSSLPAVPPPGEPIT